MIIEGRRPSPGERIDGYQIISLLHEGGMATLYEVWREGIGMPLIMKVPKLAFGDHPGSYVGFETEQMILERLRGTHVPRLVGKGDLATNPYLVMERVEGESLSRVADRAPLAPEEVARRVGAIAVAVHALHLQNVLHLDLKPGNILFRPDGEAVLIDFGLARHAQLPDLIDEQFHVPAGTGAWIAPEQLRGERSDSRSDIFAVGVIAYQLATGALPFGDPTTSPGMRRRLYVDPEPPRARNPQVPEWLQEIILRCLEIQPEARYPTAAQLAHDLAHPDQVPLTGRSRRARRANPVQVVGRWLAAQFAGPAPAGKTPTKLLASAPHVMVAIDLEHRDGALAEAMRGAVRRALAAEPELRVTLITVRAPRAFGEDGAEDVSRGLMARDLIELRHWAAPLELPAEKARFHVSESSDPAQALLDYAATQHADRIIMGARGHSTLRRFLGSVSARVVAEAPCSVTVCRPRYIEPQ